MNTSSAIQQYLLGGEKECDHKTPDGKLWLWMSRGFPESKQRCSRCGKDKQET